MSPLAHPKGKTPSRSAISERGSFLVLTARQPSVKPLANVVRRYIRCNGQDKGRNRLHWASPPSRIKWAGKAAKPLYHSFRQKDTGNDTACQSLSLWERWHCEAMTERASPARKSRRRSDRQVLCQSDTIAVPEQFGSSLALSVSSQAPRQLPQRGSHWHVGRLSSGR